MKEFQFVLDGFELVDLRQWCVSLDVAEHAFYACSSSKVRAFCSLSVNLGVHMFGLLDQVAIVFQFYICQLLKGFCNWPILSLTTNHGAHHVPWIWVFVCNDLDSGTAFDGTWCFCQLSVCVGSHFIHRS